MSDISVRNIQLDKKGTYHISIPIRFVREMDLAPKMQLSVKKVSGNILELRKLTED